MKVIDDVRWALHKCLQQAVESNGAVIPVLGFRCKAGRHRSVAIATLVQQFLEPEGIKANVELLHTEECGCPTQCSNIARGIKRVRTAERPEDLQQRWADDGHAAILYGRRIWMWEHH